MDLLGDLDGEDWKGSTLLLLPEYLISVAKYHMEFLQRCEVCEASFYVDLHL